MSCVNCHHRLDAKECLRCWLYAEANRKNVKHRSVFVGGGLSYEAGRPITVGPYRDFRQKDGRLTFSHYWRNLWRSGWTAAERWSKAP